MPRTDGVGDCFVPRNDELSGWFPNGSLSQMAVPIFCLSLDIGKRVQCLLAGGFVIYYWLRILFTEYHACVM